MNGFALRLVLKQRHKRTRKWRIEGGLENHNAEKRQIVKMGGELGNVDQLLSCVDWKSYLFFINKQLNQIM